VTPDPTNHAAAKPAAEMPAAPAATPAETPPAALPVLSYATPDEFRSEVLRDGRYIVLPHGMDFPDRCIFCGTPPEVRIPVSFSLVVPLRQVNIRVGLCRRHFRRYRIPRIAVGCIFAAGGIALCIAGLAEWLSVPHGTWSDLFQAQFLGLVALAISAALFFVRTPPVWCQKGNATASWIGGAKEPFLEQLSPVEPNKKPFYQRDISDLLR
jgi:hypothetical protein